MCANNGQRRRHRIGQALDNIERNHIYKSVYTQLFVELGTIQGGLNGAIMGGIAFRRMTGKGHTQRSETAHRIVSTDQPMTVACADVEGTQTAPLDITGDVLSQHIQHHTAVWHALAFIHLRVLHEKKPRQRRAARLHYMSIFNRQPWNESRTSR